MYVSQFSLFFILFFDFTFFTLIVSDGHSNILLDSSTLKAVNLFFRHGARTPLGQTPPKAKLGNISWSGEPGDLTKVGKQRVFNMGIKLRGRYKDFLNSNSISEDIHVTSTVTDRTTLSTKVLLTALFDKRGFKVWNDRIPLTKIPVVPDNNIIDKSNVINSPTACPAFKMEQRMAIDRARKNDLEYNDVYNYLSLYAGSQINGMYDIFTLWDTLECLAHNKLELPDWASFVYPERMSAIQARVLRSLIVGTKKMVRLSAGPYIEELHKQFMDVSKNLSSKKLVIHGGHDFSVTSNLAAFGIFEKIVNPGDAIILELHEIPFRGFYVQLLFAEDGGSHINAVPILNCGHPCPLYKFIQLTKDLISINWDAECAMRTF